MYGLLQGLQYRYGFDPCHIEPSTIDTFSARLVKLDTTGGGLSVAGVTHAGVSTL